jgi:hypothetical protein
MASERSNVVLMARVDDPIEQRTRGTRSTIVTVEHEPGDAIPAIMEMAVEIAPPIEEWSKY